MAGRPSAALLKKDVNQVSINSVDRVTSVTVNMLPLRGTRWPSSIYIIMRDGRNIIQILYCYVLPLDINSSSVFD